MSGYHNPQPISISKENVDSDTQTTEVASVPNARFLKIFARTSNVCVFAVCALSGNPGFGQTRNHFVCQLL